MDCNNDNLVTSNNEVKKKHSEITIVGIVLIVLSLSIFAFNSLNNYVQEQAKIAYVENVREFKNLTYDTKENLDDIASTVLKYWSEYNRNGSHGANVDEAVDSVFIEKKEEVDKALSYYESINSKYLEISEVPQNISDKDLSKIYTLCDGVKELYDSYYEFIDLTLVPEGFYNEYSVKVASAYQNYEDKYNDLKELLRNIN